MTVSCASALVLPTTSTHQKQSGGEKTHTHSTIKGVMGARGAESNSLNDTPMLFNQTRAYVYSPQDRIRISISTPVATG
jgi:hypothetical protein